MMLLMQTNLPLAPPTGGRGGEPLLALMGALIMVQLMMVGGDDSMVKIIGKEFAAMAGEHWVYFSPYLGAIGAFFSGSNTSAHQGKQRFFGLVERCSVESPGVFEFGFIKQDTNPNGKDKRNPCGNIEGLVGRVDALSENVAEGNGQRVADGDFAQIKRQLEAEPFFFAGQQAFDAELFDTGNDQHTDKHTQRGKCFGDLGERYSANHSWGLSKDHPKDPNAEKVPFAQVAKALARLAANTDTIRPIAPETSDGNSSLTIAKAT